MFILIRVNIESFVELRFFFVEFVVWYFIDNCFFSILLVKDNFKKLCYFNMNVGRGFNFY